MRLISHRNNTCNRIVVVAAALAMFLLAAFAPDARAADSGADSRWYFGLNVPVMFIDDSDSGVALSVAACRGVTPAGSRTFGSAPAWIKAVTTPGVLLNAAALCRGNHPFLSRTFTSAPSCRQRRISDILACSKNSFVFQDVLEYMGAVIFPVSLRLKQGGSFREENRFYQKSVCAQELQHI